MSGASRALRERKGGVVLAPLVASLAATLARSLGRGLRLHGVHKSTLDTFITVSLSERKYAETYGLFHVFVCERNLYYLVPFNLQNTV